VNGLRTILNPNVAVRVVGEYHPALVPFAVRLSPQRPLGPLPCWFLEVDDGRPKGKNFQVQDPQSSGICLEAEVRPT
jgi:hypothetical protein